MIWPAIDLQGGAVVQLVRGERCALERELEETLAWLAGFAWLQVVDLDAAKGAGSNRAMVERCCRTGFRVRLGGGIRTAAQAAAAIEAGAEQIVVGSAVYAAEGGYDFRFLESLQGLGRERIVIAVDARAGRVTTHGWRRSTAVEPVAAVRALEAWCGGFLYTSVETEGGMGGLPAGPVRALRAATGRRLSVAGGIATLAEVDELLAMGCDPVLGMALYTGAIGVAELRERAGRSGQGRLAL